MVSQMTTTFSPMRHSGIRSRSFPPIKSSKSRTSTNQIWKPTRDMWWPPTFKTNQKRSRRNKLMPSIAWFQVPKGITIFTSCTWLSRKRASPSLPPRKRSFTPTLPRSSETRHFSWKLKLDSVWSTKSTVWKKLMLNLQIRKLMIC